MEYKTSDTLRTVALERGNHVVVTFGFEVNCAEKHLFIYCLLWVFVALCELSSAWSE